VTEKGSVEPRSRAIRSDVRVLLISGYDEQEAVARFVGQGLAGFIQKPFVRADLEEQLRRLLSE
jgi:two-component system, cell cycle sensor histidine kinase and response regulator CckA